MAGGARIQRQENHGMGDVNEFVNNRTDMQKLLTIVVPVYKVEPYINKCLDSCLIYKTNEQGEKVLDEELMNQLEVIIVNDGTPDRSAEMSREYVKRYPQTFRQIDKENGGHGSAWNVGLKEATGKYLRFLDSDDWLTNLDTLMNVLQTTTADVVMTDLNNYHEDTQKNDLWQISHCNISELRSIEQFDFDDFYGKTNVMNFLFSTYKTELLQPLHPLFIEGLMYDDSILYALPFIYAKTYIYCDFVLYNYLSGRSGQSMNATVKKKNISSLLKTYQYEMEYISQQIDQLSDNRRKSIYRIMASDSSYLLHMLIYLSWYEFRRQIAANIQYFHLEQKEWRRGKMDIRFHKYPLLIFYVIEKVRQKLKTE